ncbi:MAG: DUF4129 domain-containing protein, partial [Chloroflexi bacterium]
MLLAALGLAALTILAISLNEIPFREGQQFGQAEARQVEEPPGQTPQMPVSGSIVEQVTLWLAATLLVVLIGLLLSPDLRRRMLRLFIRVAFTIWAIYYLFKMNPDLFLQFNLAGNQNLEQGEEEVAAIPVFEPPQVSSAVSYLISFAVALIFLVVVWLLYRGWKRYVELNARRSLGDIAKIARSSLDDLSSGRNSSDVIINCYLQMSDVVSNTRRLRREIAMTPHEFAARLEQAGLPGDAVTRLTHLF